MPPRKQLRLEPDRNPSFCSIQLKASVADALERLIAEQFNFRRKVAVFQRLATQQVGAEVFLVVVGEDSDDNRVRAHTFLHHEGGEEVCAGGDADGEAKPGGEALGHEDGVAVADGDHFVECVEGEDSG